MKYIEDEIPFELPEGWAWARLGNITDITTGRLDANAQVEDGVYPFFTCGEEVLQTDTFAFDCDAVLLGGNNAVGDFKMHRFSGKFNAYQRVYVITAYALLDTDYIYNHIQYYLPMLKEMSIGSQTRYLKLGMVTELLISIPPLNTQKFLSNKIKELLNYCDEIEANKSSLNDLLINTKSKILDLAIRGQLVPQDPNDEPASVLLERIRAEKEELIKQGKLKRDKKESVIFKGEDNSYYLKPENWWSRWKTGLSRNSLTVGVCAALGNYVTTVTVQMLIPLISLILRGYWILRISKKIPVSFYKKYAKMNAMQEAQSIVFTKVRCCTANFALI